MLDVYVYYYMNTLYYIYYGVKKISLCNVKQINKFFVDFISLFVLFVWEKKVYRNVPCYRVFDVVNWLFVLTKLLHGKTGDVWCMVSLTRTSFKRKE